MDGIVHKSALCESCNRVGLRGARTILILITAAAILATPSKWPALR